MNDVKTKLGQMESYEYDSTQNKIRLRRRLISAYTEKYGESMHTSYSFSIPRFVYAPVMAVIALVSFFSYEYLNRPLTAYAYLSKVQRSFKNDSALSYKSQHVIDNKVFTVEVLKDVKGSSHIRVIQGEQVFEDILLDGQKVLVDDLNQFLPAEGELAGDEQIVSDVANNLTSLVNAMVLAEVADPRDEWEYLMQREGVELMMLNNKSDDLVQLSYEEKDEDGRIVRREHLFKNFAPLETRTIVLSDDFATPKVAERVSYLTFELLEEEVKDRVDFDDYEEVFTSDVLEERVDVLLTKQVHQLESEYQELNSERKLAYLSTWSLPEISSISTRTLNTEAALFDAVSVESVRETAFPVSLSKEVEIPEVRMDAQVSESALRTDVGFKAPSIDVIDTELNEVVVDVDDMQERSTSLTKFADEDISTVRNSIIYQDFAPVIIEHAEEIRENNKKRQEMILEESKVDEKVMETTIDVPTSSSRPAVPTIQTLTPKINSDLPSVRDVQVNPVSDRVTTSPKIDASVVKERVIEVELPQSVIRESSVKPIIEPMQLPTIIEKERTDIILEDPIVVPEPIIDSKIVPIYSEPVTKEDRKEVVDQSYIKLLEQKAKLQYDTALERKDARMEDEWEQVNQTLKN